METLISVVVPVYNAHLTLRRCVDSIVQQTYNNLEIILVDDGSKDNSLDLCYEVAKKDNRIKVIHQDNAGVSAARNKGIENATGEYLVFVDSDDWIELNTVNSMIELIVNKKIDVGIYSFFNHYINKKYETKFDDKIWKIEEIISSTDLNNLDAILCSTCNKIYRSEIIKKNSIKFPDSISFGEDFIFNSKVFQYVVEIITTSKVLYNYDCTSENSGVKKLYSDFPIIINFMDEALYNLCKTKQIDESTYSRFRDRFIGARWNYAYNVCISSNLISKEKSKLINEWGQQIPKNLILGETLNHCELRSLFVLSNTPDSENQINKLINRIMHRRQRRAKITKLKMTIKRFLKV